MKFTINDLKEKGPLGHKHFKKVYDWDYFKYFKFPYSECVATYRNNKCIKNFTIEEFAYLVVATGCIDDWCKVPNDEKDKIFTADDIVQMIDVMQEYKRTLSNDRVEDFEATISYCKDQLKNYGFSYLWPTKGTKFNSDLHYAIGIVDDIVCKSGEIARTQSGGLKNSVTGQIYKFPKVYIAR